MNKKMSGKPKKSLSAELRRAAWFKWIVLFVSIFLIITGSMLIYESQYDNASENMGLIVVSSLMLILSLLALLTSTYVGRVYDISIKYLYIVILVVIFGTCVGVVGLVNAVDIPNSSSRTTLGYVFGSLAVVMGILATLWSCIALWFVYFDVGNDPKLAKFFMADEYEPKMVGETQSKSAYDYYERNDAETMAADLRRRNLADVQ